MSYYVHLCPYNIVWSEVVYLQQLQCLLNCLHIIIIRDVGFVTPHLLVSEIHVAKCIA